MILDGKEIADSIYSKLKNEIGAREKRPCLGAILVGNNPASLRYIAQKRKNAQKIGIGFELFEFSEDISQEILLGEIQKLNKNTKISWYIVQLPLPNHINSIEILNAIAPEKDVDGFHPINQGKLMVGDKTGFVPCTPAGVIEILKSRDFDFRGKTIVILGRSNIVWKPLVNLCINLGATVINCNSSTSDISVYTKNADVVILATGQIGILTGEIIGEKTIVIDVGFTVIDGKIYGDADFESIHRQGNLITPVPGWVGKLTVAMLLSNTYEAFLMQQ